MKKKKSTSRFSAITKPLTVLLCAAVLILPSLSVAGWVRALGLVDTRKAGKPIVLQTRPIDKNANIALFSEPLVSVTFDDGWESVYTTAYPLLQKYGIRTTQYIISGELSNHSYMSVAQIKNMKKSGHDIGCHSVSHADLTTLDDSQLQKELNECKTVLEDKLETVVTDFASPYGATNQNTIKALGKIYRSQRNTAGDIYNGVSVYDVNLASNFEPLNLMAVTIRRNMSNEEIKAVLDYGASKNAWVILTYHQVDDGASQYGLDAGQLEKQLKFISEYRTRIVTVGQVMDSVNSQKAGN